MSDTGSSYDCVAERYAEEFLDELSRKPFDRQMLDAFRENIAENGRICDIGCGPGHIARYLKDRGADVCGVDLSREMINWAARRSPDIPFSHGDMLALEFPDNSFAGIVCFYAIIHLRREDVTHALSEMRRVLQPGGRLVVSFHGGEGELHRDEWYGQPVKIDVILMTEDEMHAYLEAAGLEVEQIQTRAPYEFEYPTHRIYALARKVG